MKKHAAFIFLDEGEVKSYLISEVDQGVTIKAINQKIHFGAGERIQTTLSSKYNDKKMYQLINGTGFKIKTKIMDSHEVFADYVLECSKWNTNSIHLLHEGY